MRSTDLIALVVTGGLAIAGHLPDAAASSRASGSEGKAAALMHPTYRDVVGSLRAAAVPVRELQGNGTVAVTLAAGRVVAIAFAAEDQNLFWSHPQLADTELSPEKLFGGFGGDRLWFSPELTYNWDGVPNWETFENYRPSLAMDPGAYRFTTGHDGSIALQAAGELPVHGTDRRVGFEVTRSIRMVEPPLPRSHRLLDAVQYVGIETSNILKIPEGTRTGVIDLWHLLQMPVGSILVVPLKAGTPSAKAEPLSYARPGSWIRKSDHIVWRYEGEARAKFGLSASVLTGRSAVFRRLDDGRWCMIVRQFPVDDDARYVDHPYRMPRNDQVFHAWDGYGFGEMEFHSAALDAEAGPRELRESDQLWAFGGSAGAISALASHLLNVDVRYLLK